ncbi:hypothetical protein C7999DRAFT_41168 [Corynascus novoguineensis]|uniref:Uncharacterized protein n=1 Tax=Corynascus novoguineensis TaxID=1126955 RepID=A0AAN7CT93_9PEZI|nr:hypothetical protein C7999DRAFT_41168 [Corynascus novoguineensis]
MGSALSRCTSRSSGSSPSGFSVPDIGQKILDRQPNWLVPPARWRTQPANQHPVRYRTPTPYPKDDRKPTEDSIGSANSPIREKTSILEAPAASHVEVLNKRHSRGLAQPCKPLIQKPPSTLRITFEVSPRLNRFERVA